MDEGKGVDEGPYGMAWKGNECMIGSDLIMEDSISILQEGIGYEQRAKFSFFS